MSWHKLGGRRYYSHCRDAASQKEEKGDDNQRSHPGGRLSRTGLEQRKSSRKVSRCVHVQWACSREAVSCGRWVNGGRSGCCWLVNGRLSRSEPTSSNARAYRAAHPVCSSRRAYNKRSARADLLNGCRSAQAYAQTMHISALAAKY